MTFMKKLSLSAATIALLASAPAAVYAQETSSSLRGSVTDGSGSSISGASVTIQHVPSGSVSRTTTGANGAFNSSGLRVGGPYNVTITADGYQPRRVEDGGHQLPSAHQLLAPPGVRGGLGRVSPCGSPAHGRVHGLP